MLLADLADGRAVDYVSFILIDAMESAYRSVTIAMRCSRPGTVGPANLIAQAGSMDRPYLFSILCGRSCLFLLARAQTVSSAPEGSLAVERNRSGTLWGLQPAAPTHLMIAPESGTPTIRSPVPGPC